MFCLFKGYEMLRGNGNTVIIKQLYKNLDVFALSQGQYRAGMGVFQFFAAGNVQRIEIRWNNMLPSLRLLLFRIPES
jgi:hypothetical protein